MGWEAEWGLERLRGQWRLEREIPGQGGMTGLAIFEAVGEGRLLYRESGELRLSSGAQLRAEQRYYYDAIAGGFNVRFPDTGALFERVVSVAAEDGGWVGLAEHLCVADTYTSEYRFRTDGTFTVLHTVLGPRKDYSIRTVYVRDQSGWLQNS